MCGFRYPLAVWDGETPVSHEMATCRAERKKKKKTVGILRPKKENIFKKAERADMSNASEGLK